MDDRVVETHVIKWMKCVGVLDESRDRFEEKEWEAYTTVRNIFSKNRPNPEVLANNCEILKGYLDAGVKDEVFTAVRDFLKTSLIAKDNMQAFKELLEDRGFFGASAGKQGDAGNEGTVLGTATYKRVDIGGDIYEGMFLGNERVWKGKINYSDGAVYEGEWNNDGPAGEGLLVWRDGTKFIGLFKGLSGQGKIEYPDGNHYEGPWNEKGPDGYGVFHVGDRVDKGEYADGHRVGRGRLEWADGDWYEGEWNDYGANGEGVMRVGNRTDRGQYADHCRIGSGRMEWDNGDWYEGGWNDKGQHGQGTLYQSAFDRTDTGDWENGSETGNVEMRWNNGDTYTGTWSRNSGGNLIGEGVFYTAAKNKKRKGKWVNGNWKNNWLTARNVIGCLFFFLAFSSLLSGAWIGVILLGLIGFWIYEGR